MNLKEYLQKSLLTEEETIKELLALDNNICHTNVSYDTFTNALLNSDSDYTGIPKQATFLLDGEPINTYQILINYAANIKGIHIEKYFLGINSWLIARYNVFFQESNQDIAINLDYAENLQKYHNNEPLAIVGGEEFIIAMKSIFDDNELYILEKE